MKARILVLCLFACAALLSVWPATFAAPESPETSERATARPQVAESLLAHAAITILITDQGPIPVAVTLQVGDTASRSFCR
jgi:hypothetical protein